MVVLANSDTADNALPNELVVAVPTETPFLLLLAKERLQSRVERVPKPHSTFPTKEAFIGGYLVVQQGSARQLLDL